MNAIAIRRLGPGDASVLTRVAADVFDRPLDPALTAEFFADARHHLVVALDGDLVIGMATATHYIHLDKPAELFINEVGVATSHRRRGVAGRLLAMMLDHGRQLGCREAWVLTEPGNTTARRLYQGVESGTAHAALMFSYRLDPDPSPTDD